MLTEEYVCPKPTNFSILLSQEDCPWGVQNSVLPTIPSTVCNVRNDNGSVPLGATSTGCATIAEGVSASLALLACNNSNSSNAWSIVSLLTFRSAPVLCSPCSWSVLGTVGGKEARSGKVELIWEGGSRIGGGEIFWELGVVMFWGVGVIWGVGVEMFWGVWLFSVMPSVPSGAFVSLGSGVATASSGFVTWR